MDDFDDLSTLKSMREGWEKLLGKIDDYELLCELGGGGFGTVYLAKDAVSGVEYAVKGLPPEVKNSLEEQENIRANFKLVSRLSHTNIARAYVLHRAKSVWYASEEVRQKLRVLADDTLMVMEYAPGTTLSKWRRQFPEGKVPEGQALEIVRQIADALDYAHGQKIIHRDIKPSNVMVETKPDGRLTVRVLDFGLAAEIRSSMGRVSREVRDMSGTRPYMAPEQWQGEKQTAATDQYALAVLCHELLTGTVPFASVFETGDIALMKNVVATTPFAAPRELPRRIRAALEKALAKKPGERFASCDEFADALAGRVKMKGKGGVAKALLSAACVAALAAGAWQYWQNHARLSEPALAAKPAPVPAVPAAPAAPAPAPAAKPAPVPAVPAAPAPAPAAKPAPVSSARPETDGGAAATGRRQQLWEGGPYWADRNVGASSPEDSGLYFWWGDTVGYKRQGGAWVASDGSTSGFSFEEGNVPTFGLSELRARGWITAAGVLAPEHDAARVKWGGAWRMPTYRELKDLEEKCDWTWTTQNGVNGYVVRGKGKYAANSIFLPCTGGGDGASLRNSGSGGYYWSSVPYSGNSYYSWSLYFSWGNHGTYYNNRYRYYGRSVRPVQEFANTGVPEPAPAAKPAPVSSARPETDGGASADAALARRADALYIEAKVWKEDRLPRVGESDGFAERKQTLREQFTRAETQRNLKQWRESADGFAAYTNACARLFALDGERCEAREKRDAVKSARDRAGQAEAGTYAKTRFKEAQKREKDAESAFANMDFAAASAAFAAVAQQYALCADEAAKEKVRLEKEKADREAKEAAARLAKEKADREAKEAAPVSSARPETDGGAAATGRRQQLWEGGPYWADRNVGASSPEDSGLYFWWGDTVGYKRQGGAGVASDGSTLGFSFEEGNVPTSGKSLSDLRARGWITEAGVLAPEHDAARVKWGGAWRMPTDRELKDLEEKCDWTWTTQNGVNGCVVRGKGKYAANSIFLPCAGDGDRTSLGGSGSYGNYWSSVPYSDGGYSWYSWSLGFSSGSHGMGSHGMGNNSRYDGRPVRPVQGFAQ